MRAVSGGRGVFFVPPLSAGQHVSARRLGGAHGRRRRRPAAGPAGVHRAGDAAGAGAVAAPATAQTGQAGADDGLAVRRRRHARRPHHGRRRRQPKTTQLTKCDFLETLIHTGDEKVNAWIFLELEK